MNFLNKIFGSKNSFVSESSKKEKPIKDLSTIEKMEFEKNKEILQIKAPIEKIGINLSKDNSIWLIEKFRNNEFDLIWEFTKELYGDNENSEGSFAFSEMIENMMSEILPQKIAKHYEITLKEANNLYSQLKITNEENVKVEKSWIRELFDCFIDKNINQYIDGNKNVIYEIQSFFILSSGLDDKMRGFWIGEGGTSDVLSKILSVHSFSIISDNFEILITKANSFLKEMKKEEKKDGYIGPWSEISYFKKKDLKQTYIVNPKTDILEKLKSLGLGERLHFFDFASSNSFQDYWSGKSTAKTRKMGVCESESIKKMVEFKLFDYTNEIESIPSICSKKELKESAENIGFEIKKSWTLQKMYENLLKSDEGLVFLQNLVIKRNGLKFNFFYKEDLNLILAYQDEIKIVSNLLSMI
jgi:hypothetical protein